MNREAYRHFLSLLNMLAIHFHVIEFPAIPEGDNIPGGQEPLILVFYTKAAAGPIFGNITFADGESRNFATDPDLIQSAGH